MAKTKVKSHGIRTNEMNEAIVQLTKATNERTAQNTEVLAFTIFGSHDELVDIDGNSDDKGYPLLWATQEANGRIIPAHESPEAFAKMVLGKKIKYFIKTNGLGRFFNPVGMYTENRHNKVLKHAGKDEWVFKEVSNRVFTFYLNFLKSRVAAWLINAERENF